MTPRCWPTWFAPTATTIVRWPATATWPKGSRSWPGPTSAWCGPATARSSSSAQRCASSTPRAGRLRRGALDRDGDRDALSVLARAPTPKQGRAPVALVDRGRLAPWRRKRSVDARAAEIQAALRSEQLEPSGRLAGAYGASVRSTVAVIAEMNRQLARLEEELAEHFDAHPDAEIVRSLPGLGTVLGARVLGEFGDDPNRYADAKARELRGDLADHRGLGQVASS